MKEVALLSMNGWLGSIDNNYIISVIQIGNIM